MGPVFFGAYSFKRLGGCVMSRTRKLADDQAEAEERKRQEVCGYIFELLGSLETIAAQNKLSVLAKLIQSAKHEAEDYR